MFMLVQVLTETTSGLFIQELLEAASGLFIQVWQQ